MGEQKIDIVLFCGHILNDVPLLPPYRRLDDGTLIGPDVEYCPFQHGSRKGERRRNPVVAIREARHVGDAKEGT